MSTPVVTDSGHCAENCPYFSPVDDLADAVCLLDGEYLHYYDWFMARCGVTLSEETQNEDE